MKKFHLWFVAHLGSYRRCEWWLLFDFSLLVGISLPGRAYASNDLGALLNGYTMNTLWGFCLLVGIAGMAGTAQRLTYEYGKNRVVARPGLFIFTNFFGSLAAGMGGMLAGASLQTSNETTAVIVFGMAFGGSVGMERLWQAYAKKYLPIDTVLATKDADASEPATPPPAPAPPSLGPITRRGITGTGVGNEQKYD